MPNHTLYASKTSGNILVANYGLTNAQLEAAAVSPTNYMSNLKFHSSFDFLQVLGSLNVSTSTTFAGFTRNTTTFTQPSGGCMGCGSNTYVMDLPTLQVQTVSVGTSPVSNPTLLFLKIGSSKFSAEGHAFSGTGYERFFFPTYQASNNTILLSCIAFCTTVDMPAQILSSYEVKVGG